MNEGRFGAIGGTGLIFYTGASFDSSSNFDFATLRHTESGSIDNFNPDDYTTSSAASGSLSNTNTSNNSYFEVDALTQGPTETSGDVTFYATVETTDPSELAVTIESHVTEVHIWQKVEVYDVVNAVWITLSDMRANTSDYNTVLVLKDDPARFLNGNEIAIRVTHYGNSDTGYTEEDEKYTAMFDLVRVDALDE